MNIVFPFNIERTFANIESVKTKDNKQVYELLGVKKVDEGTELGCFNFHYLRTNNGKKYGFKLNNVHNDIESIEFSLNLLISSSDPLVQLYFDFNVEDDTL